MKNYLKNKHECGNIALALSKKGAFYEKCDEK
jgi:hypothetical protein